jgi:protein arginine N-methyltransferase 3
MSLRDSEGSDEGEWLDVELDEESVAITSFFDSQTFPTVSAMLENSKKHHGFDFAACLKRLDLDFHGAVKLVNYVRERVKQGSSLPEEISFGDFDHDRYLQPVLENDALIFSLDDVLENIENAGAVAENKDVQADTLVVQNKELEDELEKVRSQFANYRLAVEQTLDNRWGDDTEPAPTQKKDDSAYYFESYAAHGTISPCPQYSRVLILD